jgi:hypothetical protein
MFGIGFANIEPKMEVNQKECRENQAQIIDIKNFEEGK